MCALEGDYPVSCIGYHKRELLQKQNCIPQNIFYREDAGQAKSYTELAWKSSSKGCPPAADLTLLCEWRTWLSVSCGSFAGDALAVTDEKRRGKMMANSDSRVKAPTRGAGRGGAGDPPRAPTPV